MANYDLVVRGGMVAVTARRRGRSTGVEDVVRRDRRKVPVLSAAAIVALIVMRGLMRPRTVRGGPARVGALIVVKCRAMPAVIVQRAMRAGIVMRPCALPVVLGLGRAQSVRVLRAAVVVAVRPATVTGVGV